VAQNVTGFHVYPKLTYGNHHVNLFQRSLIHLLHDHINLLTLSFFCILSCLRVVLQSARARYIMSFSTAVVVYSERVAPTVATLANGGRRAVIKSAQVALDAAGWVPCEFFRHTMNVSDTL